MLSNLKTDQARTSRLKDVDFDNLGFGDVFSDHMFSLDYHDGRWQDPQILPYGNIPMTPGTATLHYGQSVFEGLKAFRGVDDVVRVFRPEMNARRLTSSCERLCIPPIDESLFCEAIDELVRIDHAWVPHKRGQSFYIRPLVFGTESHLEVRPSRTFRLIIMTAPVRAYFDADGKPVSLKVEEQHTRAAPGGTGAVKTAGNYAASLLPSSQAAEQGYAQVIWLDGMEHRFVEEVGAMNIFFKLGDKIVTPELRGTILPGITRDSVITLMRAAGHVVEERRIDIDEVIGAIGDGTLEEAFGAGTAAVISPIGTLFYRDQELTIGNDQQGPLTRWLYDQLTGIQHGEIEDVHGWNRLVTNRGVSA